jgi:L-ornithine Nalpha-acyltransferase
MFVSHVQTVSSGWGSAPPPLGVAMGCAQAEIARDKRGIVMPDMNRRQALKQKFRLRLRPAASWPAALSPLLRGESAEPSAGKSYGQLGNLEVRLAMGAREIAEAQRLRYQVFYEEMSAKPGPLMALRRRDHDVYDAHCDHLIVTDVDDRDSGDLSRIGPARSRVIGTYRVLRQDVAEKNAGFYTQSEYDISGLLRRKSDLQFLELGRSCVHKAYRNRRSMELLWHGLWTYIREHNVDVMIGCASFPGADPRVHNDALSFLHHHARAPQDWRCAAHPNLYRTMDLVPRADINAKAAMKAMPPLIKAYLRLGAFVGDGAVVDEKFQTTDVLVVLPVANIDPRYFQHFGRPDEVKSRVAPDTGRLQ